MMVTIPSVISLVYSVNSVRRQLKEAALLVLEAVPGQERGLSSRRAKRTHVLDDDRADTITSILNANDEG